MQHCWVQLSLWVLLLTIGTAAVSDASEACHRLDPAPSDFSHLGPEWSGRCVALYVSLSARPPDGGTVCGSGVFSAGSNLVAAAIHAGLFSGYGFATTTIVRFLPGRASYKGARRYDVASLGGDCGSGGGAQQRLSFEFPAEQFHSLPEPHELSFYSCMLATFAVRGSARGSVVGGAGGVYSQASDLATAAVHAGLLRPGETRALRVWFLPRRSVGFVSGGARNGISARSNPEPAEAAVFPDAPTQLFWGDAPSSLAEFRGGDGVRLGFQLACCGKMEHSSVRGSDVYRLDSSLAAAALHAGVAQVGRTGRLLVEFVGRWDTFGHSYRHEVLSQAAGRGYGYRFLPAE